jgi:hypothetical protein
MIVAPILQKNHNQCIQSGTVVGFLTNQVKEKAPQVLDLRGLNLVGDTWIEHVTPAV